MTTVCDCFVSVLAPVSNDSRIIEDFVAEVMAVLQENFANYELVLVDDGSNDDTVMKVTELLKRYQCIRLIRLSRKFGEEIALSAALDSAIGDFVVLMRPNWDPPQLIPEIVQKAREGTGILFGIRNNREGDGMIIRAGAWLFYLYCEKVLKINLPKNSTQFRVLSRQAVNAIMQIKVRHRYLRTLIAHIGFNTGNFIYRPINRSGRTQTRNLLKVVNLGINIIVNASRHPLRAVSWFGVIAGVLNCSTPVLPSTATCSVNTWRQAGHHCPSRTRPCSFLSSLFSLFSPSTSDISSLSRRIVPYTTFTKSGPVRF
jgi:polyisoprenyl-phosphate glycosyltransferase